ncbi:cyc2p [Saccharomyces arboricola H-6]|uniref:Cyc2p n=1 Tax=Saccharomyces arboricola (strain H-6 / AS 2.3317 / CBS 10644) TaxID=1160507 RepID=J8PWL0_SACAR|nr:cyc2p [Saccharomyces arboricola H-6]
MLWTKYASSSARITRKLHTLSKKSSFFKKFLTTSSLVTTALIGSYLSYTYFKEKQNKHELSPFHFVKYKISHKQNIDSSHFLLEVTPLTKQKVNIWSQMTAENLWSVEIKQPDVMVVRSYTPLPLKFHPISKEMEILKDSDSANGKLSFYIKKYENGEVAKWLNHLPKDHVIEIRGPFIDYEFPHLPNESKRSRDCLYMNDCDKKSSNNDEHLKFIYQPYDIIMFTAGTGVVAALQLLLTESPLRGNMKLFHTSENIQQLGPLYPILLRLQSSNRVQLQIFESDKQTRKEILESMEKSISKPYPYKSLVPFSDINGHNFEPILALICGPESYIDSISGRKYDLNQGPVKGLLGAKGWNSENVYKLS